MSSDYNDKFKQALIREHGFVYDEGLETLKPSVREDVPECPVCGSRNPVLYCVKDKFVHQKCSGCGFVYMNPRLTQEATEAFYNSDVNEVYNEEKFHQENQVMPDDIENLKNYSILRSNIGGEIGGRKLLEIGPGRGTFLAKAAADGFEVHAIELNNLLVEKLKRTTRHIYQKDIVDLELPADSFDVIYFRDVMEHIPNVSLFLAKVARVLKPGGILFIDTHNIDSIVNSITREYHTVVFAFEHPVHWSPKTLELACAKAGLRKMRLYFDHEHQSMQRIIDYIIHPSFTYIYPPKMPKVKKWILSKALRILQMPLIRSLDVRFMRLLSRLTSKGAKMQMLFTK